MFGKASHLGARKTLDLKPEGIGVTTFPYKDLQATVEGALSVIVIFIGYGIGGQSSNPRKSCLTLMPLEKHHTTILPPFMGKYLGRLISLAFVRQSV